MKEASYCTKQRKSVMDNPSASCSLTTGLVVFFSIIALSTAAFTGSVVALVSGFAFAGFIAAALALVPFVWALNARVRDDRELDEYYSRSFEPE